MIKIPEEILKKTPDAKRVPEKTPDAKRVPEKILEKIPDALRVPEKTLTPEERAILQDGFSFAQPPHRRFICVLYGGTGSGKSSLAATARRPILWHSFDPGGAESETVWPHVAMSPSELGKDKYILLNNSFELENPTAPDAMLKWATEFDRLRAKKLFRFFGTWVIDSLTLMSEANLSQILKTKGRIDFIPKTKGWDDNDYMDASNKMKFIVKQILSIPDIDIILTGHPDVNKEEISGKNKTTLALPGALRNILPIMVSEYYITEVVGTRKDATFRVRTKPSGFLDAKSRKGSALDEYEEPDLINIMRKAGYSYEHKPY